MVVIFNKKAQQRKVAIWCKQKESISTMYVQDVWKFKTAGLKSNVESIKK